MFGPRLRVSATFFGQHRRAIIRDGVLILDDPHHEAKEVAAQMKRKFHP
jgi:hypothetical protein